MEKTQQTENEVVTVWKSTQQEPNVNRMYKDTVFRRLYQDKGNLPSVPDDNSGKKAIWSYPDTDTNSAVCGLLQRRTGTTGTMYYEII